MQPNMQPMQQQPPPQPPVPPIQNRSIAMWILLSIVTCGICKYVWVYQLATEIEGSGVPERTNMSPGMIVLLDIITCGWFGVYLGFKWGKGVQQMLFARGVPGEERSTLYLILAIFGLSLVNYALMQDDLNKIATV